MDMPHRLLKPEDGTNNAIVKQKILMSGSSSSASSIDSRDTGIEDDVSDNFLGPTRTVLTPDVFDFNRRSSTNESPMMVQAGGYNPNRIPASIFASKPATPLEWSVASNDSLFSIHIGSTSFSKDHVFLLHRSGDGPENINASPAMFPVVDGGIVEKRSKNVSNDLKMTEAVKVESEMPVNCRKETEPAKSVYQEKIPSAEDVRNSTSSIHSFQFPGLQGNVGGNGSIKMVMDNATSKKNLLRHNPHPPQRQVPAIGRPLKVQGRSWLRRFCCSVGC